MNVPGLIAVHKVVTKNCRKRPIEDIKVETVGELWEIFLNLHNHWAMDSDVEFHFALTVKKPE